MMQVNVDVVSQSERCLSSVVLYSMFDQVCVSVALVSLAASLQLSSNMFTTKITNAYASFHEFLIMHRS